MKFKKTIAIFLAAVLVLQAFSVTAFAADNEKTGLLSKPVYTAIGDSTAVGFHPSMNIKETIIDFDKYVHGDTDYTCYPKLLSNKIGYTMNNLGICGLTSYGLARILTDKDAVLYDTGHETDLTYNIGYTKKPNDNNRYYDAIEKADLITLNIGSNDYCMTDFYKSFTGIMMAAYMPKAEGSGLNKELVTTLIKLAIQLVRTDTFDALISDYATNYDKIFKSVRALNKNAQIVLVGCYNPFSKDNLTQQIKNAIADGTIWARLGGDLSAFRTLMNQLIAKAPTIAQSELYIELDKMLANIEQSEIYGTLVGNVNADEAKATLIQDLVYVFSVAVAGDKIGNSINEMNEVVKKYADGDKVIYVDVPGTTVPFDARDMHPDDNGHQYIADQIFNAVEDKIKINEGTVVTRFFKNLWESIISGDFKLLSLFTIIKNSL